jgi:1-phosphofructokinase family hexose kinase
MITTVTLNPAIDKLVYIDRLQPNDTNRISKVEVDIGGKGLTVCRMLKELGCESSALGFLGGKNGQFIEHILTREGIPTDFVWTNGETRTNIAVQESDGTPPTTLNEKGTPVTDQHIDELKSKIFAWAEKSGFVVFGGSVPQGVPVCIYNELIVGIEERGAKAIFDADGTLFIEGLKATPFLVKPNVDETERILNSVIKSTDDVCAAALQLHNRGIEIVVISRGKDGAIATDGSDVWSVTSPKVEVKSTVGCGDSMVAGIVCGLSKDWDLSDCLKLGAAAGAATAMSTGADIGRQPHIDQLVSMSGVVKLQ